MRKLKNTFTIVCLVLFCASPPVFGDAPQTQTTDTLVTKSFVDVVDLENVYAQTYGKPLKFRGALATENIASVVPAKQSDKLAPTTEYFCFEDNQCVNAVISEKPVPIAVYETYKKLPRIEVTFHVKGEVLAMVEALNLKRPEDQKEHLDPDPISTGGGVPVGKGQIDSAKHLINDRFMSAYLYEKYGYSGKWYDSYEVMAYFRVNNGFRGIPLVKDREDNRDRLVFRVNAAALWNTIRQSPPEEQEILKRIFYLLMVGVEIGTEEPKLKEVVYLAGWREVPIDTGDRIRKYYAPYIFPGEISTKIENQYSIAQSVEPGYSGSAMITADGKVAGMLLWISAGRNFTGAIKIDDLLPKK